MGGTAGVYHSVQRTDVRQIQEGLLAAHAGVGKKLRRLLPLGGAAVLLLAVFTADVVRKNVEIEAGGLAVARDLMVIGAFALIALVMTASLSRRDPSPMRRLGIALVATVIMGGLAALVALTVDQGFDAKAYALLPLDYGTLFSATLLAVLFGLFALLVFLLLSDLVLFKRKQTTLRNLRLFLLFGLLSAVSALFLKPLETGVLTGVLYGVAVLFAVVNSFRLSWIVYLTKREKLFGLIYSFFLFVGFTLLNVVLSQSSPVRESLLYYSYPLRQFVSLTCVFANVYFGMAFISTLFHLPTAEAFDRKATEVSSLHTLSRLVTQVFDFSELVDSVMSMTLQVCEARSCWLELVHYPGPGEVLPPGGYQIQVAGMKNITQGEIERLLSVSRHTIRDTVLEERRAVVVDDVRRDPRFAHLGKQDSPAASLVVVPLVSHAGPIGILYATKGTEYGFFQDDVDVLSAFADQATVAIENSRLIKKSIERERLLREMMLAQEMQRKLLPQSLPQFEGVEIEAVSTPAFEVGGDYYDVLRIDESRLGIIVGDVSGKGVSAAFYMSEVKGIFQSLGRLYPSPREFLIKANEALIDSIDKHSFITLLYVVLDLPSGTLTLSRAGHCPLLHASGGTARYLRPSGMGLGLGRDLVFSGTLEEQTLTLRRGDVCVLYTDGVTEARLGDDEFGYDRLRETVLRSSDGPARGVKEGIVESVRLHVTHDANDDDLTVVVLKWNGTNGVRNNAHSPLEDLR